MRKCRGLLFEVCKATTAVIGSVLCCRNIIKLLQFPTFVLLTLHAEWCKVMVFCSECGRLLPYSNVNLHLILTPH